MLQKIPHKFRYTIFSIITVSLYGAFVVFAAYPGTPFRSSDQQLDPPCAPGSSNCYVDNDFSGTEGSVSFVDGAGDITEDNTNFFWDDTNNRLGILDATPAAALTVGDGDLFQVDENGNIIKVNNVTYSWPASQGSSNHHFVNDGSGTIVWGLVSGSSVLQEYAENPSSPSANTVTGTNTIAIGTANTVSNTTSVALGAGHTVSSSASGGAWGYGNTTSSSRSLVTGIGNTSTLSFGEHKFGTYATSVSGSSATASSGTNNRMFVVGNGTGSGARSHAFTLIRGSTFGATVAANIGGGTPVSGTPLTVGASGQFSINSSGNITKIRNVATLWPSSAGSGLLKNNGSGTFSWATSPAGGSSGEIQYNNAGALAGATSIVFSGSNFGIGDTTPASSLTVGSGDLFRVDSSGNLIKINNVTYSWPASQGSANTFLKNNGSGTLTWAELQAVATPAGSNTELQYNNAGTLAGATNIVFYNSSFGIGDTTPASRLTVGSGDLFQVDLNGNIIKVNNVTYSWPGSQGAASSYLTNNGSGTLTWETSMISGAAGSNTELQYNNAGTLAGATNIVFSSSNFGIGDTSPASLLTVGSGDLFQVDSSGDLIKVNNVTYSWPASQGGVDKLLFNNGSGGLSWSTAYPGASGSVYEIQYNNNGFLAGATNFIYDHINGRIGIGDTSPVSILTVGSGDLFQVNSSGNITKINNVTYSWPASQGSAGTFLKNNGSGTLTWATSAVGGSNTQVQYNNAGFLGGASNLVYSGGMVGIGDTSPTSLLTVGSGDLFQVNSSGNITKINNVTYSWPSAQGSAGTILKNNGSGILSWFALATGPAGSDTEIQYNNGGVFGTDSEFTWDGIRLRAGYATTDVYLGSLASANQGKNVIIGQASASTSIVYDNVLMGYNAGKGMLGTFSNTVIGSFAGERITNGAASFETIIGAYAGQDIDINTVTYPIVIGAYAIPGYYPHETIMIGTYAGAIPGTLTYEDANVIVGYRARNNVITLGEENIFLGSYSDTDDTTSYSTLLGSYSSITANVDNVVAVGYGASSGAASAVVIGRGASATTSSVVIGGSAYSSSGTALNVYFGGTDVGSASISPVTIQPTSGSGTNIAGGHLTLAGGKATGNAAGGSLKFSTSDVGASGSTLQTLTDKLEIQADGGIFAYALGTSTGGAGYDALCINASTDEITINTNGDDCVVSSQRFKTNIADLDLGLNFVNELTPRSFTYKNDGSQRIGFIAEEVEQLDPRLVFYENDGTTVRGVNYQDMTAILAKAVQELGVRVEGVQPKQVLTTLGEQLRAEVRSWLGNVNNGLKIIIANRQTARTKICIDDFCMTKDQLKTIIENDAVSQGEAEITEA